MNHVIDDLGNTVIAVGAPNSIERAKCEYPALVQVLTEMQKTEATTSGLGRIDSAAAIASQLHGRGICTEVDAVRILQAAGFSKQNGQEVFKQLAIMNDDRDRSLMDSVRPAPPGPSVEPGRGPAL